MRLLDRLCYKTVFSKPITLMDADTARKWIEDNHATCPNCRDQIKPYVEGFYLTNSSETGIYVRHHPHCPNPKDVL
jgi:hypothetical protein